MFGACLASREAPKDLKSPPLDAEVTASGLKWKILKKADCEVQKCAKPRAFDKVSVAFIGRPFDIEQRCIDNHAKVEYL